MKLPRRKFLHLVAGAAALPAVSRIARAQAYPSRPVRIIVGFPPGQSADISARLLGQWLSDRLGQSFVIDNRPGGGDGRTLGRIGLCPQSRVRPFWDGYLLLHGNTLASTARCWRNRVPALRIAELSSCGRPKYPSFRKLMTRVLGPASAGPFFRNQARAPSCFRCGRDGRAFRE